MNETELDNLKNLFKDFSNIENLKLGVTLIISDDTLHTDELLPFIHGLSYNLRSVNQLSTSQIPLNVWVAIDDYSKKIYNYLENEYIRPNQIN